MIPIKQTAFHVGTVAYWRSAAKHYHCRTWKSAMDRFAAQHGKAVAILGNDGARIVERAHMQRNGMYALIHHDLPPESVFWHNGNCGDVYARIAERERAMS